MKAKPRLLTALDILSILMVLTAAGLVFLYAPIEQLTLFPTESDNAHALNRVQRYLTARFGAGKLWRASLAYPRAPLPEWRVAWYDEQGGSDEAAQ